jgi:NTE family protein
MHIQKTRSRFINILMVPGILCTVATVSPMAYADNGSSQLISPPFQLSGLKTKTVTLAIGGGCLKAIGAIGILKVLEEQHVHLDYIYGTSCGATIGALYASGMPVSQIEELYTTGAWQRASGNHLYIKAACTPLTRVLPLTARNKWPGILAGTPYQKFLKTKLPENFSDLKIPFRAIATDLCTGEPVVIKTGNVAEAVVTSSAMPPVIRPFEREEKLLVDGGLRRNLPVLCAKRAGEGNVIIAACSDGPIRVRSKNYFNSLQRIQRRAADLMSVQSDDEAMKAADVLIVPDIDDIPVMTKNRKKVEAAIKAGEDAARIAMPSLALKLQEVPVRSSSSAP